MVVIETDGAYEQADSLKVAFDGAPATGLDIFGHSVDAVVDHPSIAARFQGKAGLCRSCQQCPVVNICGGGLYAHRYRPATGFDNPSVYCADLIKLINHVQDRLPHLTTHPRGIRHAISDAAFAQLAAGLGGVDAMAQLTEAQRSLRRALITTVYQAGSTAHLVSGAAQAGMRTAWNVLTKADREQPQALQRVLGHPYLRTWAVQCLEQLKSLERSAGDLMPVAERLSQDLGHLGAIAASVAVRGNMQARVTVPAARGVVHLPGLGRLVTGDEATGCSPPSATGPRAARLEVGTESALVCIGDTCWQLPRSELLAGTAFEVSAISPAAIPVPATRGRSGVWQPVRVLSAPGISVTLEDTDPYRDCHHWPAAPRLTGAEVEQWQRQFTAAWQEIQVHHAAYAPAIAVGLTTLMPMARDGREHDVSAAARQAFGAIGTALPDEPMTLSLLLIHEFQHIKLGAVLDLYELYDPTDKRLFHAPWRPDPRPLEGLLQGTTRTWRSPNSGGHARPSGPKTGGPIPRPRSPRSRTPDR